MHVVYGMVGLKTHAKLALVVRQEADGLRRYCHIGTGNYNPKTARLYEDLGLLTTDEKVGEDLTRLFNQLSGYAPRTRFKRLLVAPRSLRGGLIEQIEGEIAHAEAGRPASIAIKLNSIVDETADRRALPGVRRPASRSTSWSAASARSGPACRGSARTSGCAASWDASWSTRGSSCSGPPSASREQTACWIGSADMMHRNLDRRVEALVRLENPQHVGELRTLLETAMSDETSSFHLGADGTWTRHHLDDAGLPLQDLQTVVAERLGRQRRKARRR